MKTNRRFSSLIFFTVFTLILFSIFSSISCCHDQVTSTSNTLTSAGLSPGDNRILKAMMDRCVNIYVNHTSTLSPIFQEDEREALKLDIFRCNKFFDAVGWSFTKNGRLTPDYVRKLIDVVLNEVPPILSILGPFPRKLSILGPFPRKPSGTRVIASKSEEDPIVLKPMMENCVKLYLDNSDGDGGADSKERNPDLAFCGGFFFDLACYYDINKKRLPPEHIAVLKEYPRLYDLEIGEKVFQTCLILEKHGARNCVRLRAWRASRGLSVDDHSSF